MKRTIAVIGAGIGGLTAAVRLAADGHKVSVWEKNANAGGKLNERLIDGYRFDTGPSLFTMPFVIKELFEHCNRKLEDYLELSPVDPLCRYFWRDGTRFDCSTNLQSTLEQIDTFAPEDAEDYVRFLGYAADIYKKTANTFIMNPLQKIGDLKDLKKSDIFKIDAFPTVSTRVDKYFSSPYLKQVFKRFATYNGSSPYLAPATINVISYVELCQGGYYLRGGLYSLAKALLRLCDEFDIDINYNKEVKKITLEDKKVKGLLFTDGETCEAEYIFSNADATITYLDLLEENTLRKKQAERIRSVEPSCSGFVLLLGLNKTFSDLKHHNIFFSRDYEKEFMEIFHRKIMPEDPTIYIANTSYTDPEHAPEGGSNLFILVNAPYLSKKFIWDEDTIKEQRTKIIQKLESFGLNGLGKSIVVEDHITPQNFYDVYRSNKGSIYGTSSNQQLSAFLRPRNKSPYIENLYLIGGSTHPGGGIPLVMMSAKHAITIFNRNGS
ncbi:MAG: phytoene desaturase [Balneolales bacterium]|nr:phytoene desaturase [Balneolales bacterium]